MTDNTKKYRRMPTTALGAFLRIFDRSSAWLTDDHILLINRFFWVERYSRFYLSDIQAVVISKTRAGLIRNILLGIAAGLLSVVGMSDGFNPALLVWIGIFAVPLAVNTAFGPTCICCAYTAVNIHKLPCFKRIPKARVFLQTLRPLATQAQGHVTDEEIVQNEPLIPPMQRTKPGAPAPGRIAHYDGGAHSILLLLLMFGAIVSGLQLAAQSSFVGWGLALLIMGQFGMAIAAVSRQSGTDIPGGLRLVVWSAFGHALVFPIVYMIFGVVTVANSFETDGLQQLELMTNGILLVSMLATTVMCVVGRHLLRTFRNNYRLKKMAAQAQAQAQIQTQAETFNQAEGWTP